MNKGRETAEQLEHGTILMAMENSEDNKFWNVYATKNVSACCPFFMAGVSDY